MLPVTGDGVCTRSQPDGAHRDDAVRDGEEQGHHHQLHPRAVRGVRRRPETGATVDEKI